MSLFSHQLDTRCTREDLRIMVEKFAAFLDHSGYASYDPYDMWGTRYGLSARRLYYKKHPLGVFLAAPVILMEIICPRLRVFVVKKDRFATADRLFPSQTDPAVGGSTTRFR